MVRKRKASERPVDVDAEGMEMIYKQLLKNLEEAGVKPIEAVGQQFDPNFHNAVMHVRMRSRGRTWWSRNFRKVICTGTAW